MKSFNSYSTQKTDGSQLWEHNVGWAKAKPIKKKTKELLLKLIWFSTLILSIKNHTEYFWAFIKTCQGKVSKLNIESRTRKYLFEYCFPRLENWNSLAYRVHCKITLTLKAPPFSGHRGHRSVKHTQKESEEPQGLTGRVRLLGVWLRFWLWWVGWRSAICERRQSAAMSTLRSREQNVHLHVWLWSHFSRVQLFCNPMDRSPARLLCPGDSPGKNTGEGCHALLQGIFQTRGIKPVSLISAALGGIFFFLNHQHHLGRWLTGL